MSYDYQPQTLPAVFAANLSKYIFSRADTFPVKAACVKRCKDWNMRKMYGHQAVVDVVIVLFGKRKVVGQTG